MTTKFIIQAQKKLVYSTGTYLGDSIVDVHGCYPAAKSLSGTRHTRNQFRDKIRITGIFVPNDFNYFRRNVILIVGLQVVKEVHITQKLKQPSFEMRKAANRMMSHNFLNVNYVQRYKL